MVIKHTCANGVRILLEEVPQVRSVSLGIWVGTGSRFESKENNGISHFIEHMLFKGTKTRNARQIAEAFDCVGGQVNAFTSKECTCYYAKVLEADASYAMTVLADMFFHSCFDGQDMEKEKQVIGEEIKMYEDTPDDLVHDLLSAVSFAHHPLGYPILGHAETLARFQPDDLRHHMASHYSPNHVVVSIAGHVSADFISEVEAIFSDRRFVESADVQSVPIFIPGRIAQKKETEQAHICFGFSGVSSSDQELIPLMVMNNILGGGMSSRLFQNVREDKGLAYSIFSFHSAYKDSGLLTIYGGTRNDQLDALSETVFETIDAFVTHGISDEELASSKAQIKGNAVFGLESTDSRMSRNAKNELIFNRSRSIDEFIHQVDATSADEVIDMARKIFRSSYACAVVSADGKLPVAV
ncbi:MAG: pitrilysin family protein [Sporolactobacillus sp.]